MAEKRKANAYVDLGIHRTKESDAEHDREAEQLVESLNAQVKQEADGEAAEAQPQ